MTGLAARQQPFDGFLAESYCDLMRIVTHPAFRIGFLDARAGLACCNHDLILKRVETETPASALKSAGWTRLLEDVGVAQIRYEEGRLAFIGFGLRCKAWGRPDFPPASVRAFVTSRAKAAT